MGLPIRLIERLVLVLPLVFPCEISALPDIDKPLVALGAFGGRADDLDVLFEAVIFACGIGLGGRGLAEQMAQVDEMLVARRALRELRPGPLLNEFVGS